SGMESLSTLPAQVGGLSGDPGASTSEFEFPRNFSDGSQTDLQGTLGTPGISQHSRPRAFRLVSCGLQEVTAGDPEHTTGPIMEKPFRSMVTLSAETSMASVFAFGTMGIDSRVENIHASNNGRSNQGDRSLSGFARQDH